MSSTIGTVLIDVAADVSKLVDGFEKAERESRNRSEKIATYAKKITAALGGIASAAAFQSVIQGSIDAADETGKLADKLGMTVNELSRLQYVSGFAGVEMGKLEAAFAAMIRRTTNFKRDGSGAAVKAMEELGISTEFAREHFTSSAATFDIIIDRLRGVQDSTLRTALAQDVFSKSAAEVVLLTYENADALKQMGDEGERTGAVISEEMAKAAAEFNDNMDETKAILSGVANTITSELLPSLNEGTVAFNGFMKSTELDFTMATISRTVDLFNLLYEVAENGAQNVVSGISILTYGTLSPIMEMLSIVTKGLNSIGLASDETLELHLRAEIAVKEAAEKAAKDIKDNNAEIMEAYKKARPTIEERIQQYWRERKALKENQEAKGEDRQGTEGQTKAVLELDDATKSLITQYESRVWWEEQSAKALKKMTELLDPDQYKLDEINSKFGETYEWMVKNGRSAEEINKLITAWGVSIDDLDTSRLELDSETLNIVTQYDKAISKLPDSIDDVNDEYMKMYEVIKDIFNDEQMRMFFAAWQKETEEFVKDTPDLWDSMAPQFIDTFHTSLQEVFNGKFKYSKLSTSVAQIFESAALSRALKGEYTNASDFSFAGAFGFKPTLNEETGTYSGISNDSLLVLGSYMAQAAQGGDDRNMQIGGAALSGGISGYALAGSSAGPWGALIGAVVGGVLTAIETNTGDAADKTENVIERIQEQTNAEMRRMDTQIDLLEAIGRTGEAALLEVKRSAVKMEGMAQQQLTSLRPITERQSAIQIQNAGLSSDFISAGITSGAIPIESLMPDLPETTTQAALSDFSSLSPESNISAMIASAYGSAYPTGIEADIAGLLGGTTLGGLLGNSAVDIDSFQPFSDLLTTTGKEAPIAAAKLMDWLDTFRATVGDDAFGHLVTNVDDYNAWRDDVEANFTAFVGSLIESTNALIDVAEKYKSVSDQLSGTTTWADATLAGAKESIVSEFSGGVGATAISSTGNWGAFLNNIIGSIEDSGIDKTLVEQLFSGTAQEKIQAAQTLQQQYTAAMESGNETLGTSIQRVLSLGPAISTVNDGMLAQRKEQLAAIPMLEQLTGTQHSTTIASESANDAFSASISTSDGLISVLTGVADGTLDLSDSETKLLHARVQGTLTARGLYDALTGNSSALSDVSDEYLDLISTEEGLTGVLEDAANGNRVLTDTELALAQSRVNAQKAAEASAMSFSEYAADMLGVGDQFRKEQAATDWKQALSDAGLLNDTFSINKTISDFGNMTGEQLQDLIETAKEQGIVIPESVKSLLPTLNKTESNTSDIAANTAVQNSYLGSSDRVNYDAFMGSIMNEATKQKLIGEYGNVSRDEAFSATTGVSVESFQFAQSINDVFREIRDFTDSTNPSVGFGMFNKLVEELGRSDLAVSSAEYYGVSNPFETFIAPLFDDITGLTAGDFLGFDMLWTQLELLDGAASSAADSMSSTASILSSAANSFGSIADAARGFIDAQYANNATYTGNLYQSSMSEAMRFNALISSGGEFTDADLEKFQSAVSDATKYAGNYLGTLEAGSFDARMQQNIMAHQFGTIRETAAANSMTIKDVVDKLEELREENQELIYINKQLLAAQEEQNQLVKEN